MNKAQKAVQKYTLNQEKQILNSLKDTYTTAKKRCEERISALSSRKDMENLQTIIYQKQYQQAIDKQLTGILDNLNSGSYKHISDYIHNCYNTGYVGAMYDIANQGIPITVPINQNQVLKAVTNKTKLSSRMYKGDPLKGTLKEDINALKRDIKSQLSRGIANGSTWNDIAENISHGMNNPFDVSYRRSIRIARTEGHRVQQSATLDAQVTAKENGADVKKQWCATLDGNTRPSHQALDGQIVEVEDEFTNMFGETADAPGDFGDPAEDCNCRCCLLERASWGLDNDELKTLQDRATYFGLNKSDNFNDFINKYLQNVTDENIINSINSGEKTLGISVHAMERFKERNITEDDIKESIANPLYKCEFKTDYLGRKSQKFIGNKTTTVMNPDTGYVATAWKTGKDAIKKYSKKKEI